MIYIGRKFKSQNEACCNIKWGSFGILAAILHIISMQPFLISLAVPSFAFGAEISVIFLIPTFILYVIFSSSDTTKVPKIAGRRPSDESQSHTPLDELNENNLLSSMQHREENVELQLMRVVTKENYELVENQEPNNNAKGKRGKIFDYIINTGLVYMNAQNRRALKIVVMLSFTMAVINSLLVILSPCLVSSPCN